MLKRKFRLLLKCPPSPTPSSICWHYYPSIHSFLSMHSCTIFILFLRPTSPSPKKSEPSLFFFIFIARCFPFIHTSHPGSLRQEVLQLQLSAKVPLKGNPSDPPPLPDPGSVSRSVPLRELSDLTALHAANPAAARARSTLFSAPEGFCLLIPSRLTRSDQCLCVQDPAG